MQKWILLILLSPLGPLFAQPHAVFVIGTPHYNPGSTMPPLAKQLERFGFRTTVVLPEGNPEKNPKGIPGLEALREADVAIFFLRFLTLPEEQLRHIRDYVEAGKPVVGFRTSTHAFRYPQGHPLEKWNNGFGRDVLGTAYSLHLAGQTEVRVAPGAKGHPVLAGYDQGDPVLDPGTLYLSDIPADATVLLRGTGKSKKNGEVKNMFGTFQVEPVMTDDVVWLWKNAWGGRVFSSSIGHAGSFANPRFVRLFINGIHWAAGEAIPPADARVEGIPAPAREKGPKKRGEKPPRK